MSEHVEGTDDQMNYGTSKIDIFSTLTCSIQAVILKFFIIFAQITRGIAKQLGFVEKAKDEVSFLNI